MNALLELEALVLSTAKKAQEATTPLQERIDALKACAPYYPLLKKSQAKDDESDGQTIGDIQSRLRLVDQEQPDGAGVSARSRRRNS